MTPPKPFIESRVAVVPISCNGNALLIFQIGHIKHSHQYCSDSVVFFVLWSYDRIWEYVWNGDFIHSNTLRIRLKRGFHLNTLRIRLKRGFQLVINNHSLNVLLCRNESGRFGALKSDSTHYFFRNACAKSVSLRFSQFPGWNDVLNITYKITLYDVLNAASVICNRLNAELTFSLPRHIKEEPSS
jgi:hypothetical protein